MREDNDIVADRLKFPDDLMQAIDTRMKSVTSDQCWSVLQVFDAEAFVSLQCGRRISGEVNLAMSGGKYDSYGVEESKKIMKVVSKMPHIIESEIDFEPRLAYRYMSRLKGAIFLPWMVCWWQKEVDRPIKKQDTDLILFSTASGTKDFESMFELTFSDQTKILRRLCTTLFTPTKKYIR